MLEHYTNAKTLSDDSVPAALLTDVGGIDAVVTSCDVDDVTFLPAFAQFRLLIDDELVLVTAIAGLTLTITRGIEGATAAAHAQGAEVFHPLTRDSLKRHPRSMTTAGDTEYLDATGAPARLGAPSDGDYVMRWASAVPSWVVASAGLGGSIADTQVAFGVGSAIGGSADLTWDGTANTLSVFASTIDNQATLSLRNTAASGGGNAALFLGTNADAVTGSPTLYLIVHDAGLDGAQFYISLDGGSGNNTPETEFSFPGAATFEGASAYTFDNAVTATDFIVAGSRFKSDTVDGHTGGLAVYDVDGAAYVDLLTWTNANTPTADLASFVTLGGAAIATQTYVGAQGFVTATSSTAFTNKSGNISQWTNDSSFTTLAAVAGVGYLTSVNLASNVTGDLPFANLTQGSALSVLGVTGNGTADFASIAAGSDFQVLRRSGTGLAFGAVNLASSAAVTGLLPLANLALRTSVIGITIDGGGSVITTGVKGFIYIPVACTITAVTILSSDAAVTSGSIVVDVWRDSYANYPPTVADTITASAKPTLTTATKSQDTTLTGWTTAIAAGDVLGFKVDSATSVLRVTVLLTVTL